MVKKVRKCPKCGVEYSWRMSCPTCGVMLQEALKYEDETEEEIRRGTEGRGEDDEFIITKWRGEKLPNHWLRSYLIRITFWPVFFIIVVGGITVIINLIQGHSDFMVGFIIILGIGAFFFLLAAITFADETPLRKYRLIREISGLFRWLYKHTPKRGGPPC